MSIPVIRRAAASCRAIAAMYRRDPQFDVVNHLTPAFGRVNVLRTFGELDVPRTLMVCACEFLDAVLVVSTGVDNDGGRNLVRGWLIVEEIAETDGFNSLAYLDASEVWNFLGKESFLRGKPVVLYGHSGGAVVVEALARIIHDASPGRVREVQTMGSPKPAQAGGCVAGIDVGLRRRYMNVDDPVPMLPNTYYADAAMVIFGNQFDRRQQFNWVHADSGLLVYSSGRITPHGEPQARYPYSTGDVAAWLASVENGEPSHPHNALIYAARLEANLQDSEREPFPSELRVQVPRSSRMIGLDDQIRMVQEMDLQGFGILGSGGPMLTEPLVVPTVTERKRRKVPQVKISAAMKATVETQPDAFVVYWQGEGIAKCSNKSAARVIAANINRMCRNLGKSFLISSAGFTFALGNFLTLAAAAGNGVNPPLPVQ